mgnify:CR=1 FL=1|tara:strand:- start:4381 stop:4797 length:417 start_codon:yes stop_codon:yes gene_type:complete
MNKEIQLTDEQIKVAINSYINRKKSLLKYQMKMHKQHSENVNSDDPIKKEKAIKYIEYKRNVSKKHYEKNKDMKKQYYQENKPLILAQRNYRYHKKNGTLNKFLMSESNKEKIELLKNDNKRKNAIDKYPELFETNEE